MRVCPACARLFQEGQSICPDDGVFLRAPDDPLTGLTVGNYLFMGRLGQGGMGSVYRAEHTVIGKTIAIKVLHERHRQNPQGTQRFLAEARAASLIRHPNIVDITDFGKTPDERPFIVMEYLEGQSLDSAIERHGELPVYRVVSILSQVCRALHACHSVGIVHRDLKPENIILLRREGQRDLVTLPAGPASGPLVEKEGFWDEVKILDFGVARIHQVTTHLDQETLRQGLVFGSPYYMAPEQVLGALGDLRVDLYALGVITFEMLTGQEPFDGETAEEIMIRHCQDPVPSLLATRPDLGLPPEADRLVQKAMAKRPEERHPSAAHFLKDLSECFGSVIYGRDIPRFMEIRRRKTREMASYSPERHAQESAQARSASSGRLATDVPAPSAGASAQSSSAALPDEHVLEELGDLFQGKYEAPSPVTVEGYPGGEPRPPERHPRPAPAEVEAELKGLFGRKDE